MDKQMNKVTFRDMMHTINYSPLTYFSDLKEIVEASDGLQYSVLS